VVARVDRDGADPASARGSASIVVLGTPIFDRMSRRGCRYCPGPWPAHRNPPFPRGGFAMRGVCRLGDERWCPTRRSPLPDGWTRSRWSAYTWPVRRPPGYLATGFARVLFK